MITNHPFKHDNWIKQLCFCCIAVLAAVFVFGTATFAAPAQGVSKNVLILNSYHKGLTWTDEESEGISRMLKSSGLNVQTSVEYMDWKNYPSQENLNQVRENLKFKYAQKKIDIIVTTDDSALEFALQNRLDLFSDAPVVFCGVNNKGISTITKGYFNFTGVIEEVDAEETISAAIKINPKLKKIYLLYDNTESGISTGQMASQAIKRINPGIQVAALNRWHLNSILREVGNASNDSAVLMTSYYSDLDGTVIGFENTSDIVSHSSRVPVYSLYDFNLGYGAMGGSMLSGKLQGESAGKIAVRILKGEKITKIPIGQYGTTRLVFDYNQLKRFQIPTNHLPVGCEIINKPFSFFETYKVLVITVAVVFLVMAALITVLFFNLRKNNRMKKELSITNEELSASEEALKQKYKELAYTQQTLINSEERHQLILFANNDPIWDWELETQRAYFSKRWEEAMGYHPDELGDVRRLFQLVFPEDTEQVQTIIRYHLAHKTDHFQCEFRMKKKDGEYVWVSARGKALFHEDGTMYRMGGSITDISGLKEYEEKLHDFAYYDALTKLPNRHALYEKVDLMEKIQETKCALLFIDSDNFKFINDTMGHFFGDRLISEIGKRIEEALLPSCSIYRLGGDEFVVLLEQAPDTDRVEELASRIIQGFTRPFSIENSTLHTSVSIGIALCPDHGADVNELLKCADIAMYKAKGEGKNKYFLYDSVLNSAVVERMQIEKNLRTAMERQEFRLFYQPQLDIRAGKISGFEALLRWNNAELGSVPPDKFIPVAEDTHLIVPLGAWVLESACRFIKKLEGEGFTGYTVSVNVSVVQIMQQDFEDTVMEILQRFEVIPEQVELEITESVLAKSFESISRKLENLRSKHIGIALDDFGKGYSSLNYLKQMPITTLKIDKDFTDTISTSIKNRSLIDLILTVGRSLNMNVVAEGVETEEQMDYLRRHKCSKIQGYLFSVPLPEEQVFQKIREQG